MPEERIRILVRGRVQGVFFRASTQERAEELGLTGWVRNLADGTVEAVAEGSRDKLDKLVEWCRTGPPKARVTDVDIKSEPRTGEFEGFSIERNKEY